MAVYHAAAKGTKPGQGGLALCGAKGIDGYKTNTVSAKEWNHTIPQASKCLRCIAAIQRLRAQ